MKLNDYQNAILFYGKSYDGDLKDLNRGEDDGTLLIYNYKEKPENPNPENPDPENPDPENPNPENPKPENPKPEVQNPDKPDASKPATLDQPDSNKAEVPDSVKTGDHSGFGLWLVLAAGSVGAMVVVFKKKKIKKN